MPFWYWLVLAAVLGVIEIAVPVMFCIWLAAAALGVGAIAWRYPDLSWEHQALIFAVLAIASVALGRTAFARTRSTESGRHLNAVPRAMSGGCSRWKGQSSTGADD
jgi:inner membrane protein